jgi:DNA-binding NarL/FixJ family response regulator
MRNPYGLDMIDTIPMVWDSRPPRACPLTDRELQFVKAIAAGMGRKGAAELLGVSEATVKTRLACIKRKLYVLADPDKIIVNDNSGMVFYCLHKGWIS